MLQMKHNPRPTPLTDRPATAAKPKKPPKSGIKGKTVPGRLDIRVGPTNLKTDVMNIRCRVEVRDALARAKMATGRTIVDLFDEMVTIYLLEKFGLTIGEGPG